MGEIRAFMSVFEGSDIAPTHLLWVPASMAMTVTIPFLVHST